ncbi:uncharacterized protein Pyn_18097 [Prunus yedoensis var. nudiflora]|uniref:Uncharacterized protein n=1 Tax=Prunus yedoensis var. nudiflora TaxID=2094558 RepID=A0A314XVH4_PRUYE|nr:uncharacterized protein Pyn_18097 [Prunus yedoensis var. nudiflora]
MILKRCCCSAHIDLVGLVGRRFCAAAKNLNLLEDRNILYALDSETFAQEIVQRVSYNDVVLDAAPIHGNYFIVAAGQIRSLQKFLMFPISIFMDGLVTDVVVSAGGPRRRSGLHILV